MVNLPPRVIFSKLAGVNSAFGGPGWDESTWEGLSPCAVHCPASLGGWVQGTAGCVGPPQGALSEETQSRGMPHDPDWSSLVLCQEKRGAGRMGEDEVGCLAQNEEKLSPLRTEPPWECPAPLAGGLGGHPLEIRLSSVASGHSASPPEAPAGFDSAPCLWEPNSFEPCVSIACKV